MATLYSTLSCSPQTVADPGEGPRGPPPLSFKPKLRPEGPKKICLETAPRPLSKSLDDRALPPPPSPLPPHLKDPYLDPALPKSTYKFFSLISMFL